MFFWNSCLFDDPIGVGNLIPGSSAFSKTNLNIWNYLVHTLLSPPLGNFEHYFASVWDGYNCAIVLTFFVIAFLWDWNENWPFLAQWPLFSSVQFSCPVMSDSLWPHEPQHARPPYPSPIPWVHPNPCPLSQWCQPTISSSVILFSSCPQSFPISGSFQMSQLFSSGGQSIGVSASTSCLPMNTQDWYLGWTGWIS